VSARFIVADVFDGLATLPDGSVDLVVTSPPFLALRSYLPADHPEKSKEIGSEATPAEFVDVLLKVTAELRRVLAPHGSIAIELGDTYAGSGGAGGDYDENGLREGQPRFQGSSQRNKPGFGAWAGANRNGAGGGTGWPLAKSKTLIPELYRIALAYGFNPLTGQPSPAGQWRVRNVVTWCRPNPPVGALGDKWRPATSDVVVACVSGKRYWDDLATRRPHQDPTTATRVWNQQKNHGPDQRANDDGFWVASGVQVNQSGAPLLDYWEIPPGGFKGSHYAVFPPELVVPLVKAMCPEKVCRVCGEPSRRVVEQTEEYAKFRARKNDGERGATGWTDNVGNRDSGWDHHDDSGARGQLHQTLGWTDCGHNDFRPGLVLDPFAGSGTTLLVAHGHGHDSIGFDLDERNLELARERVGPFFFDEVTV
jgi:hypothetical protein